MKLIFIHGRAQEAFEENILKLEWTTAFTRGLKNAGFELSDNVQIEFPYYGKLLKRLVDEAHTPASDSAEATRSMVNSRVNDVREMEFSIDLLAEIAQQTSLSSEEQRKVQEIRTPAYNGPN